MLYDGSSKEIRGRRDNVEAKDFLSIALEEHFHYCGTFVNNYISLVLQKVPTSLND